MAGIQLIMLATPNYPKQLRRLYYCPDYGSHYCPSCHTERSQPHAANPRPLPSSPSDTVPLAHNPFRYENKTVPATDRNTHSEGQLRGAFTLNRHGEPCAR